MLTDDPGSTEPLVVTRDGPVATLWLNRPEKRNAVTKAMWEGIATTCAELAADGTVRVHGRPRHGRSLLCRRRHRGARARRRQLRARERGRRACARLVSEADDRVRARFVCRRKARRSRSRATFASPTPRPGSGSRPRAWASCYPAFGVDRAVRLLGPSATKHLLYSAELIDTDRALRIGMVDEVHDPAAAFERLDAFATLLATERSLLTQESSKAMVDECVRTGEISRVTEARWAGELAASGDPAEGVAAFFERRSPRFTWAGPSQ